MDSAGLICLNAGNAVIEVFVMQLFLKKDEQHPYQYKMVSVLRIA